MSYLIIKRIFIYVLGCILGVVGCFIWKKEALEIGVNDEKSQSIVKKEPFKLPERTIISKQSSSSYSYRDLQKLNFRLVQYKDSNQFKEELCQLMEKSKGQIPDENLYWALSLIFSAWAQAYPIDAWKSLDDLDGPIISSRKYFLEPIIFNTWFRNDPQSMRNAYAEGADELKKNPSLLTSIIKQEVLESPEKTWSWIASLTQGEQNNSFLPFFESLSLKNPELMRTYLNKLQLKEDVYSPLLNPFLPIIKNWSSLNAEEAFDWAKTAPESWQKHLKLVIIEEQSKSDLTKTNLMIESMPENQKEEAIKRAGFNAFLVIPNPGDVLPWLMQILETYSHLNLDKDFAWLPLSGSTDEAMSAFETISNSDVRDKLYYQYIKDNKEYADSKKLVDKILNPEIKEKAIEIMK